MTDKDGNTYKRKIYIWMKCESSFPYSIKTVSDVDTNLKKVWERLSSTNDKIEMCNTVFEEYKSVYSYSSFTKLFRLLSRYKIRITTQGREQKFYIIEQHSIY